MHHYRVADAICKAHAVALRGGADRVHIARAMADIPPVGLELFGRPPLLASTSSSVL